jgi:hypothetical protein
MKLSNNYARFVVAAKRPEKFGAKQVWVPNAGRSFEASGVPQISCAGAGRGTATERGSAPRRQKVAA